MHKWQLLGFLQLRKQWILFLLYLPKIWSFLGRGTSQEAGNFLTRFLKTDYDVRGLVYLSTKPEYIWAKPGRRYLETWQVEKSWSFQFSAADITPFNQIPWSRFPTFSSCMILERPGMRVACTTWLWILSPELWLSGTSKSRLAAKVRQFVVGFLHFFLKPFFIRKYAGKTSLSRKIGEDVQFVEKFHMGWKQHLGPYSWITSIMVFVLINKMSKPLVHRVGWSKVDLPLFPRLLDKIWHQAVEWWLRLWKWSHL